MEESISSYKNPCMENYTCDGQISMFDYFNGLDPAELERNERINHLFNEVRLCNFIVITDKDVYKRCVCSGNLEQASVSIKYRSENKMKHFVVNGLRCLDCERKYVTNDTLIAISEDIF